MKCYIIAGEPSGDLHGSNLIKELKSLNPSINIRCWGGELMERQGATLVKHYKELAFMGFLEVVKNLGTILKNIRFCKQDIAEFNPDVVIFIDYPGFNLRIAPFVKQMGIKTFYYISPQLWAWKESRISKIKASIDELFVILPFEKDFYEKHNYPVHFVGHPLLDAMQELPKKEDVLSKLRKTYSLSEKPIIALLPGSRKQEIKTILPIMLQAIKHFPAYQFIIAGAPNISEDFFASLIKNSGVKVIYNETYSILQVAQAALVTSGTATLETGIIGTPQIVCYKGSKVSYYIAKKLVKVKYISLVNLILNKLLVTELIQNDCNEEKILQELFFILTSENKAQEIKRGYEELKIALGEKGASHRTAKWITNYFSKK